MRIAIDIDNIITNTAEGVLLYINERLNTNIQISDIKSYWMESAVPQGYEWIVEQAFEDPKMWKKVKLIDGAAQFIQKLYEDGHEIYFATATTEHNFRKKVGFLTRSFPFLPAGYVKQHAISIKNKQLLNVDVMIDDYLKNLTGERLYTSICLKYPWNTGDAVKEYVAQDFWNFHYAENWAQIYTIIRQLDYERKGLFK